MYRQDEPEVNLEQILKRVRSFFKGFGLRGGGGFFLFIVLAVLTVAAVIWLASGFYTVQPGEQAALRRLGVFENVQGPGLHWWWPSPIGTVSKVQVEEVRRLELGIRGDAPFPAESLMITGDLQIVDAQLLVQYDIQQTVTTPDGDILQPIEAFLFKVQDPDGSVLKSAAETSLRQVVGLRDIDDVLADREAVESETKAVLQGLLDQYQTGIRVSVVKLQSVLPPPQVQPAFDDVNVAIEEKAKIINLAQAYEADIIPKAEGAATKLREAAEAFKRERIAIATGQAERFLTILNEYNKAQDVTRQRLYLEAMEKILVGVSKRIVDEGTNVNIVVSDSDGSVVPIPSPE